MLWKLGCGTMLLASLAFAGSILFLGKAAQEATEHRQAATLTFSSDRPGPQAVSVEGDSKARLRLEAVVELSEQVIEENPGILSLDAPVNFQVLDATGATVHQEGADLQGSEIVPASDSPHFDSFDPKATLAHDSHVFEVPADGRLVIAPQFPDRDTTGNPVIRTSVQVFDRVSDSAGGWAWGGFITGLFVPLIGGVGFVMFLIGVVVAISRKNG